MTDREVEIVKEMYTSGLTVYEIAKRIGHRATYVSETLKNFGLFPVRGRSVNRGLNDSYFYELDTYKKAYYIGLLFADGSVVAGDKGRSPMIRLELSACDASILDDLKGELGIDATIKENNRPGRNQTKTIGVRSKRLADDLAKYGIVPNKTLRSDHLPAIPHEHVRAFIHGLIDGDGSIYHSQGTWHINFCSHFESICEEFEAICSDIIGKDKPMSVQVSNGVYRVTYNGRWARALAKECIVGTFGIDRKLELANKMFK